MQTFLKYYYDQNYIEHEVHKIDDYVHQKVWNVYFDEAFDAVYIFLA